MLNVFTEKGNTTTYEYTYGEAPLSIVEPPLNIKADEDDSNVRVSANVDANVQIFLKRKLLITHDEVQID